MLWVGWEANKQAGKPTNRLGSQQTGWEANKQAGKPTNRMESQQTGWEANKQAGKPTKTRPGSQPYMEKLSSDPPCLPFKWTAAAPLACAFWKASKKQLPANNNKTMKTLASQMMIEINANL